MPIVHVICATLKPDAAEEAVAHAIALGRALPQAHGVRHAVLGRSADRLVAVTWLEGREALEPFAASPVHMAFIMRGLAPCIAGMWSAAVESDAAPPAAAVALWVFALRSVETLFEWQVRDLLGSVAALPGAAAAGPTVEERERYRAGGVVCLDAPDVAAFDAALRGARDGWGALAEALVEAKVEVIPLRHEGDSAAAPAHDR
ncbi:MAG: hypothetical protein AB7G21_12575 [Dehalococcoidia bacterium]